MVIWKILVDTWWYLSNLEMVWFCYFSSDLDPECGNGASPGSSSFKKLFLDSGPFSSFGTFQGTGENNLCLGREEYVRLKLIMLGLRNPSVAVRVKNSVLVTAARNSFYFFILSHLLRLGPILITVRENGFQSYLQVLKDVVSLGINQHQTMWWVFLFSCLL